MKIKAYRYEKQAFDIELFQPVSNVPDWCKPKGGCWFSPIKTKRAEDYQPYGWAEWCEDNGYTESWLGDRVRSEYRIEGKVLVIDDQFDPCSIRVVRHAYTTSPDFEWLVREGYDAILLTQEGLHRFHMNDRGFELYGWDLESVLVLNPAAVTAWKTLVH